MKKLFLPLMMAVALFSTEAGAILIDPYIGADYNYIGLNLGDKNEKLYGDNFNAAGVVAGVKLLSFVSAEAFYQQSGSEKQKSRNYWAAGDELTTKIRLKAYGVDVVTDVLNLGVAELLSSIGYGRYEADISSRLVGNGMNLGRKETETGHGLRFGLGAQVNPLPSWGIRAMFRYTVTNLDTVKNIKEVTIGLRYYF